MSDAPVTVTGKSKLGVSQSLVLDELIDELRTSAWEDQLMFGHDAMTSVSWDCADRIDGLRKLCQRFIDLCDADGGFDSRHPDCKALYHDIKTAFTMAPGGAA